MRLGAVQETLFIPLAARARETQRKHPVLRDPRAVEMLRSIDYDAASLMQVGTYHGWSVYTRNGDRSTIYIPTTPGRLAPYTTR